MQPFAGDEPAPFRVHVLHLKVEQHPGTQADLFRAVLEETQQEVGRRVAAAADAHDDSWTQLTVAAQLTVQIP